MPAQVTILLEGYYEVKAGQENTRPTVTLVRDGDFVMVVDPGVMESQQLLIDALAKQGLAVDDVDVVCLTHSHIDHYRNVGMFPKAKVLEYFGLWEGGRPTEWQENFSENIQIIKTPGHDYSCITLLVKTEQGVAAICGDVFWKENYPEKDPYASDVKQLEQSRALVLKMAQWIIPGHGGMYKIRAKVTKEKAKNGKKVAPQPLGHCKDCARALMSQNDRCVCQEWLCYNCCECEDDCDTCNCSHKR